MARKRVIAPGLYHHIYNRGNDRHPIFKRHKDYQKYLLYLKWYTKKHKIVVLAYALMEWHMHLFIFDPQGMISFFVKDLHGHYAQLYNRCYDRSGHVFGRRFCNKIVDADSYGIWLSRYIHRQAVEADLVATPEEYPWTSYHVYRGFPRDNFVNYEMILKQFGDDFIEASKAYQIFVKGADDGPVNWQLAEKNDDSIIGSNDFVNTVASRLKLKSMIKPDINNALDQICGQYNVKLRNLCFPKGKDQRFIRRQAIAILSKKYSVSTRKIAKALNVSPGLVSTIARDDSIVKRIC